MPPLPAPPYGAQCSQCVPGVSYRAPFSWDGACVPCPSTPAAVLSGYLFASAAVASLVFSLQHHGVSLPQLSLALELLQLLSLVGMIDMDWPTWLARGVFPAASAVAGNLDLGAVGCVDLPEGCSGGEGGP